MTCALLFEPAADDLNLEATERQAGSPVLLECSSQFREYAFLIRKERASLPLDDEFDFSYSQSDSDTSLQVTWESLAPCKSRQ